jgi:hypothetical protein
LFQLDRVPFSCGGASDAPQLCCAGAPPQFHLPIGLHPYPGKYSYPGKSKQLARRDMNKKNNIILKAAAILLILIGLLAMLVAWQLLLVAGVHNSTVVVLEMGGVVVCMIGYFLRRRVKALEKDAEMQIKAAQSAAEDPHE